MDLGSMTAAMLSLLTMLRTSWNWNLVWNSAEVGSAFPLYLADTYLTSPNSQFWIPTSGQVSVS